LVILKKIARFLLFILLAVVVIFGILVLAIRTDRAQNFIVQKAISFVSEKTKTKIELDHIYLGFFDLVQLEGLYAEDLNQDTLIYASELNVSINLFSLMGKKINISSVELKDATANLKTNSTNGDFNFQFFIDAFASKDSTATEDLPNDTSAAWGFGIDELQLSNIRFKMEDPYNGINLSTRVGELSIEMDEFDLNEEIIKADRIEINQLHLAIELIQGTSAEVSTDSTELTYHFGANTIAINESNISFIDQLGGINLKTVIGELDLAVNEFDLINQKIDVESLKIAATHFDFNQEPTATVDSAEAATHDSPTQDWLVDLRNVDWKDFEFNYNDNNSAPTTEGIDFSHLGITISNLEGSYLHYNGLSDIKASFAELSISEKSGFKIDQLQTDVILEAQKATLSNLLFKTKNGTVIKEYASLSFKSLETIGDDINALDFDIQLNSSKIAMNDLFYFSPEQINNEIIANNRNQIFTLSTDIKGNLNNLFINQFYLSGFRDTRISINGVGKEVLNFEKSYYDLKINTINTTQQDLKSMLGDSLFPTGITLPKRVTINGSVKGTQKNLTSKLIINSDLTTGSIAVDLSNSTDSVQNLEYKAALKLSKIELGKIIQDTTFGSLNLEAYLDGKGLDFNNIESIIRANINEFTYKNYTYNDLVIDGKLMDQTFMGNASMNDTNLIFNFDGLVSMNDSIPEYKFKFDLVGVDLQRLHLTEDDYRIQTTIAADVTGNNIDDIVGNFQIREFQIKQNDAFYRIDSLLFVSFKDTSNSNISIDSDLLTGNFKGNIAFSELGNSMKKFFQGYYNDTVSTNLTDENQQFSFDLTVRNNPVLSEILLPDLQTFEGGYINGEFNSNNDLFNISVSVPNVNYSNIQVDSLDINVRANKRQLDYELSLDRVSYDQYLLKNIALYGKAENDTLTSTFQQLNDNEALNYFIEAISYKTNDVIVLKFLNDNVILDQQKWKINPKNEIVFGENIQVNNFKLSHENETIQIRNPKENLDTLTINFKGFRLENLLNLVENTKNDSIELLTGMLNGSTSFWNKNDQFQFEADLKLDSLSFLNQPAGNLSISANNATDLIAFKGALTGYENDVSFKGNYSDSLAPFNFLVDIKKLQLKTLESFSFDQLKESEGYLSGKVSLKGSAENPDIKGEVKMNNAKLRSTYLNSFYTFGNDKIEFEKNTLLFKQFTVKDSIGNPFSVDGKVVFTTIDKYNFDLVIKSKNFQALNTTKEGDNDLFYGKVLFSSNIKVKGDQEKPIIDADLKLNEGTDFTFVLPSDDPSEISREGVVVFVDKSLDPNSIFGRDKTSDTIKSDILGLDVTARIEIDEKTNFNIVVDPIAGDKLNLLGGGVINAQIDRSGKVTLIGQYIINSGFYDLTLYDVVKRKFEIKPGSSITWSGDPLEAEMDISAIYNVKASPLELLSQQSGSFSESDRLAYQEKLPFEVYLMMKNELLKPEISFKIDLPDDNKAALNGIVYQKLQELNEQESELNKQVFALIILRRFIASNSFNDQNDGSNLARNSVSKVLNQQLNRLSDRYVKGINLELNVDSYEDYSTTSNSYEGRTELNLAVSKSFLNDKISVKVGGDVDLEGERAKRNTVSDFAGDVTIEYSITDDGRYKAKLYRDNRFEGIIEGDIVETGVALIYTRDYESLKQLFKKPENLKEEDEIEVPKESIKETE
jgi:hypothetical protein